MSSSWWRWSSCWWQSSWLLCCLVCWQFRGLAWWSGEGDLRLRVLVARALSSHTAVLHTDLRHDVLVVTPQCLVGDLLGTHIDVLDVTNLLENILQTLHCGPDKKREKCFHLPGGPGYTLTQVSGVV